jgi:hypothetical protein
VRLSLLLCNPRKEKAGEQCGSPVISINESLVPLQQPDGELSPKEIGNGGERRQEWRPKLGNESLSPESSSVFFQNANSERKRSQ